MEEIKVGEYIRTDKGNIFQYIDEMKDFVDEHISILNKKDIEFLGKITKHSFNLIDLIELGDIVNKETVVGIETIYDKEEKEIGKKIKTEYRIAQYNGLDYRYYIHNTQIKTILTHEQYEARCFKVEE